VNCQVCGGKVIVVGEEVIDLDRSVYVYECLSCQFIRRMLRKPKPEDYKVEEIKEKVVFT